jgi:hypothetical protein
MVDTGAVSMRFKGDLRAMANRSHKSRIAGEMLLRLPRATAATAARFRNLTHSNQPGGRRDWTAVRGDYRLAASEHTPPISSFFETKMRFTTESRNDADRSTADGLS